MAIPEFPRRGAWAVYNGKVGVINAISGNVADFHVTNAKGETEGAMEAPLEDLTQATRMQIPKARRPDADAAAPFGY